MRGRYAREDAIARRAEKKRLKATRRLERELAKADLGSSDEQLSSSDSSDLSIELGDGLGELAIPNVMIQEPTIVRGEAKRGVQDGGRLLIPADPDHVPMLCQDWAALRCPLTSSTCTRRHYFVTHQEREVYKKLNTATDMLVERAVVHCITEREECMERIHRSAAAAQRRFQEHDGDVQPEHVAELLSDLNQMRIISVRVVEAIGTWRKVAERRRAEIIASLKEKKVNERQGFAVRIEVVGGQIYPKSPAFTSKLKKYVRPAELEKKRKNVVYLGVYKTETEALLVYEEARRREAIRHGVAVSAIRQARVYAQPCGVHYGVETVGMRRVACEECGVRKLDGDESFTAPFLWNGKSYMLQMLTDLTWLDEFPVVRTIIGPDFPLHENPFLLAPGALGTTGQLLGGPAVNTFGEIPGGRYAATEAHKVAKAIVDAPVYTWPRVPPPSIEEALVPFVVQPKLKQPAPSRLSQTFDGEYMQTQASWNDAASLTSRGSAPLDTSPQRGADSGLNITSNDLGGNRVPLPPAYGGRMTPMGGMMVADSAPLGPDGRPKKVSKKDRKRERKVFTPATVHRPATAPIHPHHTPIQYPLTSPYPPGQYRGRRALPPLDPSSRPATADSVSERHGLSSAGSVASLGGVDIAMESGPLVPSVFANTQVSETPTGSPRTHSASRHASPRTLGGSPRTPPLPRGVASVRAPSPLRTESTSAVKLDPLKPRRLMPVASTMSMAGPYHADGTMRDVPDGGLAQGSNPASPRTPRLTINVEDSNGDEAGPSVPASAARALRKSPPRSALARGDSMRSLGLSVSFNPEVTQVEFAAGESYSARGAPPEAASTVWGDTPRSNASGGSRSSFGAPPPKPKFQFGVPNSVVAKYQSGVVEWFGHMATMDQPVDVSSATVRELAIATREPSAKTVSKARGFGFRLGGSAIIGPPGMPTEPRNVFQLMEDFKYVAARWCVLSHVCSVRGLQCAHSHVPLYSRGRSYHEPEVGVLDLNRIREAIQVLHHEKALYILMAKAKQQQERSLRDDTSSRRSSSAAKRSPAARRSAKFASSRLPPGFDADSMDKVADAARSAIHDGRSTPFSDAGDGAGDGAGGGGGGATAEDTQPAVDTSKMTYEELKAHYALKPLDTYELHDNPFAEEAEPTPPKKRRNNSDTESDESLSDGEAAVAEVEHPEAKRKRLAAEKAKRKKAKRKQQRGDGSDGDGSSSGFDSGVSTDRDSGSGGSDDATSDSGSGSGGSTSRRTQKLPPGVDMDTWRGMTLMEKRRWRSKARRDRHIKAAKRRAVKQSRWLTPKEWAVLAETDRKATIFFEDKGASFALAVTRKPRFGDKAREFCRHDEGTWKTGDEKVAMRMRGRNLRHWHYDREVVKRARQKEADRAHIVNAIRRAIKQRNTDRLENLVMRAEKLRGAHVDLAAARGRKQAKLFRLQDRQIVNMQRTLRGGFYRLRRWKAEEAERRRLAAIVPYDPRPDELRFASAAHDMLVDVLSRGIENKRRKVKQRKYSRLQVLDGEMVLLTITSLEHWDETGSGAASFGALDGSWPSSRASSRPSSRAGFATSRTHATSASARRVVNGWIGAATSSAASASGGASTVRSTARSFLGTLLTERVSRSKRREELVVEELDDAGRNGSGSNERHAAGGRTPVGTARSVSSSTAARRTAVSGAASSRSLLQQQRDSGGVSTNNVFRRSGTRSVMSALSAGGARDAARNNLTMDTFGHRNGWFQDGRNGADTWPTVQPPPCPSCAKKRMGEHYDFLSGVRSLWSGPCTCARARPPERMLVTAFTPMTRNLSQIVVEEADFRARVLALMDRTDFGGAAWAKGPDVAAGRVPDPCPTLRVKEARHQHSSVDPEDMHATMAGLRAAKAAARTQGASHDTSAGGATLRGRRVHHGSAARAPVHLYQRDYLTHLVRLGCELKPLPTDEVTGVGVGAFKRCRFEPLREVDEARRCVHTAKRQLEAAKRSLAAMVASETNAQMVLEEALTRNQAPLDAFREAHAAYIRQVVHEQAMTAAAEDAIKFSTKQIDLYENLNKASHAQAWDQLEDATEHVLLRRKRRARHVLTQRLADRQEALLARSQALDNIAEARGIAAAAVTDKRTAIKEVARLEKEVARVEELFLLAWCISDRAMELLGQCFTLRWSHKLPIRRKLMWREPWWTAPKFPLVPRGGLRFEWREPPHGLTFNTDKRVNLLTVTGFNCVVRRGMVVQLSPVLMAADRRARARMVHDQLIARGSPQSGYQRPTTMVRRVATVSREAEGGDLLVIQLYDPSTSDVWQMPLRPHEVHDLLSYADFQQGRHDLRVRRRFIKAAQTLNQPVQHQRTAHHEHPKRVRQRHIALANELLRRVCISQWDGRFQIHGIAWLRLFRASKHIIGACTWTRDTNQHIEHPAFRKPLSFLPPGRGPLVFKERRRIALCVGVGAAAVAMRSAIEGVRNRGPSLLTLPRVSGVGKRVTWLGNDAGGAKWRHRRADRRSRLRMARSRGGRARGVTMETVPPPPYAATGLVEDGTLDGNAPAVSPEVPQTDDDAPSKRHRRIGIGAVGTGEGEGEDWFPKGAVPEAESGVYATVAVYANHGDLQLEVYAPRHASVYRLCITYAHVEQLLRSEAAEAGDGGATVAGGAADGRPNTWSGTANSHWLRMWADSVRVARYSRELVRHILDRLQLVATKHHPDHMQFHERGADVAGANVLPKRHSVLRKRRSRVRSAELGADVWPRHEKGVRYIHEDHGVDEKGEEGGHALDTGADDDADDQGSDGAVSVGDDVVEVADTASVGTVATVASMKKFVDRRDFWVRRVEESKERARWVDVQRSLQLEEPESTFVLVLQLRRDRMFRRVFTCTRQVYGRTLRCVVKMDHHGHALFEVYDPEGSSVFRLHVARPQLRVAMANVVQAEAAEQVSAAAAHGAVYVREAEAAAAAADAAHDRRVARWQGLDLQRSCPDDTAGRKARAREVLRRKRALAAARVQVGRFAASSLDAREWGPVHWRRLCEMLALRPVEQQDQRRSKQSHQPPPVGTPTATTSGAGAGGATTTALSSRAVGGDTIRTLPVPTPVSAATPILTAPDYSEEDEELGLLFGFKAPPSEADIAAARVASTVAVGVDGVTSHQLPGDDVGATLAAIAAVTSDAALVPLTPQLPKLELYLRPRWNPWEACFWRVLCRTWRVLGDGSAGDRGRAGLLADADSGTRQDAKALATLRQGQRWFQVEVRERLGTLWVRMRRETVAEVESRRRPHECDGMLRADKESARFERHFADEQARAAEVAIDVAECAFAASVGEELRVGAVGGTLQPLLPSPRFYFWLDNACLVSGAGLVSSVHAPWRGDRSWCPAAGRKGVDDVNEARFASEWLVLEARRGAAAGVLPVVTALRSTVEVEAAAGSGGAGSAPVTVTVPVEVDVRHVTSEGVVRYLAAWKERSLGVDKQAALRRPASKRGMSTRRLGAKASSSSMSVKATAGSADAARADPSVWQQPPAPRWCVTVRVKGELPAGCHVQSHTMWVSHALLKATTRGLQPDTNDVADDATAHDLLQGLLAGVRLRASKRFHSMLAGATPWDVSGDAPPHTPPAAFVGATAMVGTTCRSEDLSLVFCPPQEALASLCVATGGAVVNPPPAVPSPEAAVASPPVSMPGLPGHVVASSRGVYLGPGLRGVVTVSRDRQHHRAARQAANADGGAPFGFTVWASVWVPELHSVWRVYLDGADPTNALARRAAKATAGLMVSASSEDGKRFLRRRLPAVVWHQRYNHDVGSALGLPGGDATSLLPQHRRPVLPIPGTHSDMLRQEDGDGAEESKAVADGEGGDGGATRGLMSGAGVVLDAGRAPWSLLAHATFTIHDGSEVEVTAYGCVPGADPGHGLGHLGQCNDGDADTEAAAHAATGAVAVDTPAGRHLPANVLGLGTVAVVPHTHLARMAPVLYRVKPVDATKKKRVKPVCLLVNQSHATASAIADLVGTVPTLHPNAPPAAGATMVLWAASHSGVATLLGQRAEERAAVMPDAVELVVDAVAAEAEARRVRRAEDAAAEAARLAAAAAREAAERKALADGAAARQLSDAMLLATARGVETGRSVLPEAVAVPSEEALTARDGATAAGQQQQQQPKLRPYMRSLARIIRAVRDAVQTEHPGLEHVMPRDKRERSSLLHVKRSVCPATGAKWVDSFSWKEARGGDSSAPSSSPGDAQAAAPLSRNDFATEAWDPHDPMTLLVQPAQLHGLLPDRRLANPSQRGRLALWLAQSLELRRGRLVLSPVLAQYRTRVKPAGVEACAAGGAGGAAAGGGVAARVTILRGDVLLNNGIADHTRTHWAGSVPTGLGARGLATGDAGGALVPRLAGAGFGTDGHSQPDFLRSPHRHRRASLLADAPIPMLPPAPGAKQLRPRPRSALQTAWLTPSLVRVGFDSDGTVGHTSSGTVVDVHAAVPPGGCTDAEATTGAEGVLQSAGQRWCALVREANGVPRPWPHIGSQLALAPACDSPAVLPTHALGAAELYVHVQVLPTPGSEGAQALESQLQHRAFGAVVDAAIAHAWAQRRSDHGLLSPGGSVQGHLSVAKAMVASMGLAMVTHRVAGDTPMLRDAGHGKASVGATGTGATSTGAASPDGMWRTCQLLLGGSHRRVLAEEAMEPLLAARAEDDAAAAEAAAAAMKRQQLAALALAKPRRRRSSLWQVLLGVEDHSGDEYVETELPIWATLRRADVVQWIHAPLLLLDAGRRGDRMNMSDWCVGW